MDSSAILWILAWSGVLSIAIFVITGLLGQLIPLIDAWRTFIQTLKDGATEDRSADLGQPTPVANEPENRTRLPASSEGDPPLSEPAVDGKLQCEMDDACSTPPWSHQ
ncbi:hypothetical protein [Streptomyces mirabilis]